MALSILRLRGAHGQAGWRFWFFIEGLIEQMPASPAQTKKGFYLKGWFTEEEEKLIVNRMNRNDLSKSVIQNHQDIDWQKFEKELMDFDVRCW